MSPSRTTALAVGAPPKARSALLFLCLALATLPASSAFAAVQPAEIQSQYRQVLGLLAGGDEKQALTALGEFETGMLSEYPGVFEIERFWRIKLGVIRELVDSAGPEVMIPVIVFHHDAYLMYRDLQERYLAPHSRRMASELAELYASRSERPEDRLFAGWVLTSFGGYLQDVRSVKSSAEYFRRGLVLSPSNETALLAKAAAHEKHGEYLNAMRDLAEAVRINPDNHHARLRLALCQLRGGERFNVEDNVKKVLKGDSTGWIRSIAYQELGKYYLEEERLEKAEQLLRKGLEELPNDQGVALVLATLLERDLRVSEAFEVLNLILPRGPDEPSPRLIYDSFPREGLADAREVLHEMMVTRLDILSSGLTSGPMKAVVK